MFDKDKSYKVKLVSYTPKEITENKGELGEETLRVFDIKFEMEDPESQGVQLPCRTQDGQVIALKWIKTSRKLTVEFAHPAGQSITSANCTVTVDQIRMDDVWVMPVRVRAKMSADLAQYLYEYFQAEVGVRIFSPQGSLDFKGNRKARLLDGKAKAAGEKDGDEPEQEEGDAGIDEEAAGTAPAVDLSAEPAVDGGVENSEGAPEGKDESGDVTITGLTNGEPTTAQALHDEAMKAKAEREAAAKIYDDAWEKLKDVPGPAAKGAMTYLACIAQDTRRPEAVREQPACVHDAVKKLAEMVNECPDPSDINLVGLYNEIVQAEGDYEMGKEETPAHKVGASPNLQEKPKGRSANEAVRDVAADPKVPFDNAFRPRAQGRGAQGRGRAKKRLRDVAPLFFGGGNA